MLVVDDNSANRVLAQALIRRQGCEAKTVADGQQALDVLAAEDFDLVLMDVHMPVMDGLVATRQIRLGGSVRDPRVPIVALTASALPEDRDACLACGMNAYITKPIHVEELKYQLTTFLGSGRPGEPCTDDSESDLDYEQLLRDLGGDIATAAVLIADFKASAAARVDEIVTSLATGDHDAVVVHAHALVSRAIGLGARRIARIARELERQAAVDEVEREKLQAAPRLLREALSRLDRVVAAQLPTAA